MRVSFVVLVAFLAGCASGPDVTDEVMQPPTQAQKVSQPVAVKQSTVMTEPAGATKTECQKPSRCQLLFEKAKKEGKLGTDWVTSVVTEGSVRYVRVSLKKKGKVVCSWALPQEIRSGNGFGG